MKIQVLDGFVYFDELTSIEKQTLERLDAVLVKKKGLRLPLHLWSLREIWKHLPSARTEVLEKYGKLTKEEFDRHVYLRQESELVQPIFGGLRPYQAQDEYYLRHLKNAAVFNEPRTGKTPTLITLVESIRPQKTIVVAPASLIWNWSREFKKWYIRGYQDLKVVSGTKVKRKEIYDNFSKGILVISKDTLKQDIDVIKTNFDVAIVDEAHFLRNYKTAQSKAVFKIKADRKYALTGTPSVKHPSDVYGILHFLFPTQYPSFWQFAERYFDVSQNHLGYTEVGSIKPSRLEELQQLLGIISVQRKRSEVMQWLPDKERTTFYCEMSNVQKKLYDEMAEYFIAKLDEEEVDAPTVLAQLTRLRQLCLEPSLLGFDCNSAKTDALVEYVNDLREPVVIMSMFTSYLDRLENIFGESLKVAKISGKIDSVEKQRIAEQFQRGEIDVLLCNIISAGTGFTLDRAETIIFTDKAWNPADNEQAEDRITPTTEDKVHKHHIVSFVCQNTVDERINELLEQKKSLTDLVNDGGSQAIKFLLQKP